MKITDQDGKRRILSIIIAAILFVVCFHIASASTTIEYSKPEERVQKQEKIVRIEVVSASDEQVVNVPEDSFLYYASFCESTHRQFAENGDVLQGRVDPDDTGRWQINKRYWLKSAQELGYDIDTEHGNYLMAQHIMQVQGEGAWSASAPCIAKNFGYIIK